MPILAVAATHERSPRNAAAPGRSDAERLEKKRWYSGHTADFWLASAVLLSMVSKCPE